MKGLNINSHLPLIGMILSVIGFELQASLGDPWETIGRILVGVGLVLTGGTVRRNNVSSEQAGAKPTPTESVPVARAGAPRPRRWIDDGMDS